MPVARKGRWRVGGELVDPEVPLAQRKQLAELLGQAIANILDTFDTLTGGKATVSTDAPLVLHGDAVPEGITDAVLHREIDEPDNHITQIHSFEHNQGERDPLDVGTPVAVAAANAEGTAIDYARRDHEHEGVHSIDGGAGEATGDLTFVGPTQVGNTFTFATGAGLVGGVPNELQYNAGGAFGGTTSIEFVAGASGGIDFAGLQAIAMACHNGATLPTSPTLGQWFLHTPTGRKVLMQYSGSAWQPIMSLGAVTVYVNSTSGTDSADLGYGTGASAWDTVQYAINQLPGILTGDVIVNLAATMTYAEAVVVRGKSFTGNYTITIQGALPTADDSGTSSGAGLAHAMNAAGLGTRQAALNDTSKTWGMGTLADSGTASATTAGKLVEAGQNFLTTVMVGMVVKNTTDTTFARVCRVESDTTLLLDVDIMVSGETYQIGWGEHSHKLLVITGGAGSGQVRVIEANYATRLHVVGVWATTPTATSTYSIYDMDDFATLAGDTFAADLIEINGQKGVTLKYLNFENWSRAGSLGEAVLVIDGASAQIVNCRFFHDRAVTVQSAIQFTGFSATPLIDGCLIERSGSSAMVRGIRLQQSIAAVESSNIHNTLVFRPTGNGIDINTGSSQAATSTGHGNVIRKPGGSGYSVAFFSRATITRCTITEAQGAGVDVQQAFLNITGNNEISSSVSHNIAAYDSGVLSGPVSTTQVNYAGGYGVFISQFASGSGYTAASFTANALGNVARHSVEADTLPVWAFNQASTGDILQLLDNGAVSFAFMDGGRIYGTALHNNAGAVTGTTNQYIASGTYTPTLFNTTNVSASTSYVAQWMRVGNVVTVSGKVDIDTTLAASSATELGLSLPIPSAFTAEEQLGGDAASDSVASLIGRIRADAVNDRASIVFKSISLTNDSYSYTYTYLIL